MSLAKWITKRNFFCRPILVTCRVIVLSRIDKGCWWNVGRNFFSLIVLFILIIIKNSLAILQTGKFALSWYENWINSIYLKLCTYHEMFKYIERTQSHPYEHSTSSKVLISPWKEILLAKFTLFFNTITFSSILSVQCLSIYFIFYKK